ncbi:MAG: 50S ribosomal protein L22 [Candidatus Omnitrophota bacterium]
MKRLNVIILRQIKGEDEMLAKAEAKYLRMSARKAGLVLELINGKTVEQAVAILDNVAKRACGPIKKVLKSAFANANNGKQDKFLEKDLIISKITADGGPMLRRYRAATMGRASIIRHRTTHLHVELDQKVNKVFQKKRAGSK